MGTPGPRGTGGFSLVEALVTLSVLGILALLGLGHGREELARLQVEMAARRLMVGVERGRDAAERRAAPCALELGEEGWRGAETAVAAACGGAETALQEGIAPATLELAHTFAGPVEFTANGLAVDGGTVVVGASGTALVRCLVMSPPLGVTRLGRYGGSVSARPDPALCQPDPLL